jgi:aspartate/methionine/tyrosine aminotransferase
LLTTYIRSDDHIILSSGSVDHSLYSLPAVLKDCLHYALHRDWYGYSDSRGRLPTRDALAQLENVRVEGAPYTSANIVVAIGGTWTVSAVADFLGTCHRQDRSPALCGVPGYPPLVEAISRRQRVALIPLPLHDGFTRLDPLIEALRPDTPLVLLQSVINPTGSPVYEPDLARLIERAAPSTFVILDECHECLGPALQRSSARARRHVIRVNSLSKALSVPGMKIGWFTADVDVVRGFYEYASTSYGSPPSLFYLLLEVMARMERWLLEGLDRVGHEQYAEFEREYGLTEGALNTAFESYRRERLGHDADLIACRERTVAAAAEVGATVVPPSYSLNVLLKPPTAFHSYLSFRRTLARAGVATYPGGLCFGLDDGWLRVSPGVAPSSLCRALQRLQSMWREEGR